MMIFKDCFKYHYLISHLDVTIQFFPDRNSKIECKLNTIRKQSNPDILDIFPQIQLKIVFPKSVNGKRNDRKAQ